MSNGTLSRSRTNVMNQKDFAEMGFKLEVRFGDYKITKMDKHEIRLPVKKLIQHPYYAAVECKVNPCGPKRINAKNDIAIVDVDDLLLSTAIDKDSIYPVRLPDVSKSYVLKEAKWRIYSENSKQPILNAEFFSEPATYSVTEIPIVVDMKVSSCRAFTEDGRGIFVPSNGSICLSQISSAIGSGDPIVSKSPDGDYVLIGVGQTSLLSGKEHFQETGTRWVGYNTWH